MRAFESELPSKEISSLRSDIINENGIVLATLRIPLPLAAGALASLFWMIAFLQH